MDTTSVTRNGGDHLTTGDLVPLHWSENAGTLASYVTDTRMRAKPDARALGLAQRIVAELFGDRNERRFTVRYWTASEECAGSASPLPFTLVLNSPGALRRMLLLPTETRLAAAFLRGDFDVQGNLEAATWLATPIAERLQSPRWLLRLLMLLVQLPRETDAVTATADPSPRMASLSHAWRRLTNGRRHAKSRDAMAIKHHYDVGNDFYKLFLDEQFAYSCAYFPTGAETLERAQEAKFELICRKLRLRPGERLLDIGCGWGGLIVYAVEHYGVVALGITLSEAQATLARERISSAGLDEQCRVRVCDYRDLERDHTFDKVASIGMFEHVGREQLSRYFSSVMRLMRPGGLFLNHGIVSLDDAKASGDDIAAPARLWGAGRFIDRYVFPDGELVPLATAVGAAEAAGFETRDMESLREHYAETLRHWMRRLDDHADEARALIGDMRVRVWRLYMAASAHAFATAHIGIVQLLLTRPTDDGGSDHPRTRADLYAT